MKAFIIINSMLLLNSIEIVFSWKCGLDKLKISPKLLNIKSNKSKKNSLLTSSSYIPISIGYDFTTLQKSSSMSSSTFNNVKFLLQETRQ